MENGYISLTLGDWLWNASVVGFINIIGEDNVRFEDNTAIIAVNCLDNFEEKYFSYFIDTYEKLLPWYKIVSFKNTIEYYRKIDYETLGLQDIQKINSYIRDTAKKIIKQRSIISALELMGIADIIKSPEKNLKTIKEPKNETVLEKNRNLIIEEINSQFEILNNIIDYFADEKGRRYIGAKNVIYSIINKAWDGVSFFKSSDKRKRCLPRLQELFCKRSSIVLKS